MKNGFIWQRQILQKVFDDEPLHTTSEIKMDVTENISSTTYILQFENSGQNQIPPKLWNIVQQDNARFHLDPNDPEMILEGEKVDC